jgi:hypothetical protein
MLENLMSFFVHLSLMAFRNVSLLGGGGTFSIPS